MNCRLVKKIFCIGIFLLSGIAIAENDSIKDEFSAERANRQTALRYLRLAKNYAVQGDWKKAFAASKAGNDYDKSVADLWYLMAFSQYNEGEKRKTVIPVLEKSLDGAEWVDYNKSAARIFYADLLCSTGKPSEALSVLDEAPFIYSADAEYTRIKSYYEIGTSEAVQKAREKVDVSRRIYPADIRFPHLFFAYEYRIMYSNNAGTGTFDYMPLDSAARKTADYFITRVPEYDRQDPEIEVYAAIFAEDDRKTRLLQAFDARGLKSPMYAAAALEDGVIGDQEALDYFLDFMEKGVDLFEVERFASVLKDGDVKKKLSAYLNAYSGVLFSDTNRTLENNLEVTYSRGRPAKIVFDGDNDGGPDWSAELDFGLPKSARFYDKKIDVYYGTYPSPVRIVFEEVPGEQGITVFNLADETVDAEIFRIKSDEFLKNSGITDDFYVVDDRSLWNGIRLFDIDRLILSISSMEKPSVERDGAFIRFSMLSGQPYAADYIIPGEDGNTEKVYAHAQFTKPLVRNLDRDGDGIFETCEIYADRDSSVIVSEENLNAAASNIWGSPVKNPAVYLKMIQIDRNNDTRPDFTEEYLTNNGKITVWDSDYDGNWEERYTIMPRTEGEPFVEKAEFYLKENGRRSLVSVTLADGAPTEVLFDNETVNVTKGSQNGFYWVGRAGSQNQEMNIFGQMAGVVQGVVMQFDDGDYFLQAILVGNNIYARAMEKSPEVKNIQNENKLEKENADKK